MRKRKARGYNRKIRCLKKSVNLACSLDINRIFKIHYLSERLAAKSCRNITFKNSIERAPNRRYKKELIDGLITIYDNWKVKLDALGLPYYLKIWWFEPKVTLSQVVCGIEERIGWYENIFEPLDQKKASLILEEEKYLCFMDRTSHSFFDYLEEESIQECSKSYIKYLTKGNKISVINDGEGTHTYKIHQGFVTVLSK